MARMRAAANSRSRMPLKPRRSPDSIVYVLLCADRGFYGGFGGYSGEGENEEDDSGNRRPGHRRRKQIRKAKRGLRSDRQRTACSQYNIGYSSTNPALDGTFRKVEIHASNKDYKDPIACRVLCHSKARLAPTVIIVNTLCCFACTFCCDQDDGLLCKIFSFGRWPTLLAPDSV